MSWSHASDGAQSIIRHLAAQNFLQDRKGIVKKKTRTEITVETDELLIIRRRRKVARALCPECGAQAMMIPLEEAVTLSGVSSRVIHRWAEAGQIHFRETPDGFLLVCLDALLRLFGQQENPLVDDTTFSVLSLKQADGFR
jgi:hypothetical protein